MKNQIEYKVYKDQGVVVAIAHGCTYDAINRFDTKFVKTTSAYLNISFGSLFSLPDLRFYMPNTVRAVARLHPEDKWDENIGKEIAYKKLCYKYEQAIAKRMRNIFDVLCGVLDKADKELFY